MAMADIRQSIVDAGAVLEGKFIFALKKRGNVSSKYINFDAAFPNADFIFEICDKLIELWADDVQVIAAPAVGGIPLIYAASRSKMCRYGIRTVWADKQKDGTFVFERMGFANIVKRRTVVILEDVVSTGSSCAAVAELVRQVGGELLGGSFIWNRGNVTAESAGLPELYSLVTESVETWRAEEHPHWGEWPLVEDIGHPEYFPNYPGPRIKLLT